LSFNVGATCPTPECKNKRSVFLHPAEFSERGFLHPAEFSEICGAKDLFGFMRLSDLLKTEKRGAKNRFALFLHSGFMKYVQKTASLYFCTPDL